MTVTKDPWKPRRGGTELNAGLGAGPNDDARGARRWRSRDRRNERIGDKVAESALVEKMQLVNAHAKQQFAKRPGGVDVCELLRRNEHERSAGPQKLECLFEEEQVEIEPPFGGQIAATIALAFRETEPSDGHVWRIPHDIVKATIGRTEEVFL